MKTLLRFFALSVPVMALFAGCTAKLEPHPLTYTQILTGTEKKAWRMVSYQIFDNGKTDGVQSVQTLLQPCEADDQFVFYANAEHKFEYTNGATKCDPSETDVIFEDSWTLINGNASLEFVIPVLGGKFPWTIKNLTETSLTVEYYFPDIEASYRFTFNSTTK
ncbi:hypothetical protein EHT25_20395 [Larkinella rosea]|uniref:Lipocalin-like domain-containing protein n=2 Tax=Larkinella rosea TaxID=2025312 RepID=A0A3P1BPG3_9BACT|nr:hypothetical protein EHT25_20395 [Larkinella rosea]